MTNITSLSFLIFISITTLIYYLIPKKKYQWIVILIFSLIFYISTSSLIYVLLSSIITYLITLSFNIIKNTKIKRFFLGLGVIFPIIILIILKYDLISYFKTTYSFIIPLGISYYTLSLISYVTDYYKNEINNKNFFKFFTSIIYFPILIEGPITRYQEVENTLFSPHKFSLNSFKTGIMRIIWGFFKQLVIASRLQIIIDYFINNNLNGVFTIITLILYSLLIYINFSAGIDIVIGFSKILQIDLTENFKTPYFSKSLNEFWKKWHISLTNWFRDYIYIPLGGNRHHLYLNILIVFIVSGMWHGTTINFLLWGLAHGVIMIIERLVKFKPKKKVFFITNFLIVSLLWIFFVYSDINVVTSNFLSIFNLSNYNFNINYLDIMSLANYIVLFITLTFFIVIDYLKYKGYKLEFKGKNKDYILVVVLILITILLGNYGIGFDKTEFIYNGW